MKHQLKLTTLALSIAFVAGCTQNKTNSREEVEIRSMDSTSRIVKDQTKQLEEQTKKVEASLEKLDKEFDAND